MIITFFSNYFNHHQKALCDSLDAIEDVEFHFVATEPMEEFRKNMGWSVDDMPSYVMNSYDNEESNRKALELSETSDLVIIGSAPEKFIEKRLEQNKLIFRYTERPLKEGVWKKYVPHLYKRYKKMHYQNRDKNIYVLGASAYAAYDYKILGAYTGRILEFGYFPEGEKLSEEELFDKKTKDGVVNILWTGRFLRLKHPELLIKALKGLSDKGIEYRATIVGNGEMEEKIKSLTDSYGLKEKVQFIDFVKPEKVRKMMQEADIYVCTSNHLEGWGSVIYEGESAGCAVIASHLCGSTPFLIKPGKTGFIFKSGDYKSLLEKLELLINDKELLNTCGRGAYRQMQDLWNPQVAAKRIVEFSRACIENKVVEYDEGPLSYTPILKNNWYRE